MEGHVSAKIPCNPNSTSALKIFIAKIRVGQPLELKPVQLQLVRDLSRDLPGYTCVYHESLPFTTATRTAGANTEAKGNNTDTAVSGVTAT
jgi:hypothetical protein